MAGTVVIVGRPNVGKSTLFNRLVGKRLALVDAAAGVTRDRREGEARLGDLTFTVVDTAGLEPAEGGAGLAARLQQQTAAALREASVALFLTDARAGVLPLDRHFATWIRRSHAPVIAVANKCDGGGAEAGWLEAFALGLGEPIALSAEQGEGMTELYAALAPYVGETGASPAAAPDEGEPAIKLAVVGRPNVGKSTLVNRLLGTERVVTGPEPGLTRDAIAVEWRYRDRRFRLIDTAGLRRRANITAPLEKMAVRDALRAIRLAQIVILVVDATGGFDKQDLTIASRIADEGRALVIVLNKWDAVADRARTLAAADERLAASLPQVRGVPLVPLSASTGEQVDRLMPAALRAYERWNRRVPTAALNRWLAQVGGRHPPPLVRGRPARLRYAVQIKARPPTFAVFANQPLPADYVRYLANGLREAFDLAGVPLRIVPRRGKNPYVPA